jgi:SagB-type dehydrogenase family enzyme
MKHISLMLLCTAIGFPLTAQNAGDIRLNEPDLNSGKSIMQALSARASASAFDTTDLSLQDLSNLVWAANGINRPAENKRTAPSSQNSQDVDIYVVTRAGMYYYNFREHLLNLVVEGDYRKLVADRQQNYAIAPVHLILVSDISRFRSGTDSAKVVWAAMDVGIVSQNIGLFCAGTGLSTRPRATMNQAQLRELLKLSDKQHMLLNHPVSYTKE